MALFSSWIGVMCGRNAGWPVSRSTAWLVGAEQVRGLDLEVAPEVADAVAAVQRAADDVVQAQAALAVADDLGHVGVERGLLAGGHERQVRGPSPMAGVLMRCLRGQAGGVRRAAAAGPNQRARSPGDRAGVVGGVDEVVDQPAFGSGGAEACRCRTGP